MLVGELRRRAAHRAAVPAAGTEPDKSALDIVKWVVPSVGVFVALVGFVSESAHQALLGVERGDIGAAAYIWSAGEFVRAVIRAISSAAFLPRFFSIDSTTELWLLATTLAVVGLLYVIRRMKGQARPPLWQRMLFTTCLVVVVGWRLLTIEVPLARVEHLLTGGARVMEVALQHQHVTSTERAILKRAVVFYSFLLCERQPDATVPAIDLACQAGREYSTDAVRLMLVVIGVSAATLAIIGLLWAGASTTTAALVLAPMALYCSLAPAFVYGKLVKPPLFESALIQVKTGLHQMPAQTAFGRQPGAAGDGVRHLLTAIILGRDEKVLSLYVSQSRPCGASVPTYIYEWVPWQVPVSEVVAIREIQSLDVVSERLKQVSCPDSLIPR